MGLYTLVILSLVFNSVTLSWAQAAQIQDIIEPAIIVVEPGPPVHTQGGKLSLTCVAYGEPELPTIIWSAPSLGVVDFSAGSADPAVNATIYTSIFNDTETRLVFVISVLELCDVNYTYSFVDDFSCLAVNGDFNESTISNNISAPITVTPIVYEPASILAAPSSGQFVSNGPRISATCAIYGSPIPSIQWTQDGQVVTEDSFTNIYTQSVVDQDGDILVISTLEMCDSVFMRGGGMTSCITWNGVEFGREERVQSVNFTIDPRTALESFAVQLQGDTAQFRFSFSAPLTLNGTRCFFDKLKIANTDNTSSEVYSEFQPLYPGFCPDTTDSNMVVGYLDPRDFRLSLDLFMQVDTINLLSVPNREIDFIPFIALLPITDPLRASALTLNTEPRINSFDVDFNTNRVILHFTDYMDISTFESDQLVLVDPTGNNMRTLTPMSRPIGIVDNHVRTVCITLSNEDLVALTENSICTTIPENCSCYFSSSLVSSFSGVAVQDVPPSLPLPVSKLKLSATLPAPAVYMQLSLSYEGCAATYNLTEDEVYILRLYETVTRIECWSSGLWDNVSPVLSFEMYEGPMSFSSPPVIDTSSIVLDWPRHVYLDIPSGLPPQNFGLFMCTTRNTSIQHYLYNMTRYLALPDGGSYTAMLYDNITIPFVLGSDPLIDITRPAVEIVLYDTTRNRPALIEPVYRKLSSYRGEVIYNLAPLSLTGQYTLRIVISGDVIATTNFNIVITPPSVSIIPSVLAVLPSDIRVTIECLTSSPAIPVMWVSALNSTRPLSNQASYTLSVPSQGGFLDGQNLYCVVRNPGVNDPSPSNIVASAVTTTLNILDQLVILNDGQAVENLGQIAVVNRLFGNLSLQCVGHFPSEVVNLEWISEENGEAPVVLQEENNNEYMTVFYDFNSASLVINNLVRPYRGTVRCRSASADIQTTIFVTDGNITAASFCEGGDTDEVYGMEWETTAVGSSDNQPCPAINGLDTQGVAFRRCLEGNEWDTFVNVSNCQTPEFTNLRDFADTNIFSVSDMLTADFLNTSVSMLTSQLFSLTTPSNLSLLPLDLDSTNYMMQNIITLLPDNSVESGIFSVIDNVLDPVNEDGWKELNRFADGSRQLLKNIENFGAYVVSSQQVSNTKLEGEQILFSAQEVGSSPSNVTFPNEANTDGQVMIPAALLAERRATGVAIAVIRSLNMFLPQPQSLEDNMMPRVVGSVILSTQIFSPEQGDFVGTSIRLNFNTTVLRRVGDPVCNFWNESTRQWDDRLVTTDEVTNLQTGEFKSYSVQCSAGHTTAFAVILDMETEEFDFTVTVYIGCGAIIFSAVMSIFSLFFSCLIDKLRLYTMAQYFTHMSFCISLICSFVGFLAGIELALDNEIGCIATAAALHYFFTAAFSWLFCESLLLVFYPFFSKHCSAYILLFLIGWTLPAIPTAITLGLLRDDYTTSQHCWFFFDGTVVNFIVLSFVIPKLILAAATILILVLGCITTQLRSHNLEKGVSRVYIHLLRFMWFGLLLLLALLILTWIFAVLLVNVFGINSTITGWVFLGACIALAIWLFLFIVIVSILNQKVDYNDLWSDDTSDTTVKTHSGPHRNREYEMMPKTAVYENTLVNMDQVDNPIAQENEIDIHGHENLLAQDSYEEMEENLITLDGDQENLLAQDGEPEIQENPTAQDELQEDPNAQDADDTDSENDGPDLGEDIKENLLAMDQ